MIAMTLADIATVVGATLHAGDPARSVTAPPFLDSRAPEAGGLFVAVAGERVDGHDFAAAAVAGGAVAVLSARPLGVPCLVVDDPVHALGRLATHVTSQLTGCRVVGVTGSQGKTSTKDLVAGLLEPHGPTVAARGSFNNELGVPLTALRADAATRHLVVEMGARGSGHIRYLTGLVQPDVAVVLNVGVAHLGEFGTREDIARSKGELVEALHADGVAVLNADDDLVRPMAARTSATAMWFGRSSGADVRVEDVTLDQLGRPRFTLRAPAGTAPVAMQLLGEHQADNAAAAAAAALSLGVELADVVERLGRARPRSRARMEVRERSDGVTIINDAYNANPDSMKAALKTLAALGRSGRRTVAVLGEMRELGEAARDAHDAIGRLVVRLNVDRLVVVGEPARAMHLGASLEGSWDAESVFTSDVRAAVELLRGDLRAGDVVLVKASQAARLDQVAEALLEDEPPEAEGADR